MAGRKSNNNGCLFFVAIFLLGFGSIFLFSGDKNGVIFGFALLAIGTILLIIATVISMPTKRIQTEYKQNTNRMQELDTVFLAEEEFPAWVNYTEHEKYIRVRIEYDKSISGDYNLTIFKIGDCYRKIKTGDDLIEIALINNLNRSKKKTTIIKSRHNGIFVAKSEGEFSTCFGRIYPVKDGIEVLNIEEHIEAANKEQEEINRKKSTQREEEQEKEKIKERILKNKRKRELEKQAMSELIEGGEVFGQGNKRTPIPKDVVDAVWNRDSGSCVYCGSSEKLHIDHIIPFSKGGDDSLENLQILCQRCNLEKSNKIG